jgi:hypothetical protein
MTLGREGNRNVQNFPSFGRGFDSHRPLNDDSIGLAYLNCLNLAEKWSFLDPKWTPVMG